MQTFTNALKSAACCRKIIFISIAYVRDLKGLHGKIHCARTFILHNPSLFFCIHSHRHARQTYLFSVRLYLYRTHYHETRGSCWKNSSNIAHRVVLIMEERLELSGRERVRGSVGENNSTVVSVLLMKSERKNYTNSKQWGVRKLIEDFL